MPPKRRRQALTSDGVGTLLRSSPTETADAPILQVVELQRLALDARWLHAAREATRPLLGDAFDAQLSDGTRKFKCVLSTELNPLVYRGWLRNLAVVRVVGWRRVIDERLGGAAEQQAVVVVVTGLEACTMPNDPEGAATPELPYCHNDVINYGEDDELPFHPESQRGGADAVARQTQPLPLLGARKHYLRLDSDEVLLTERWTQGAAGVALGGGGGGGGGNEPGGRPDVPASAAECPPLSGAHRDARPAASESSAVRILGSNSHAAASAASAAPGSTSAGIAGGGSGGGGSGGGGGGGGAASAAAASAAARPPPPARGVGGRPASKGEVPTLIGRVKRVGPLCFHGGLHEPSPQSYATRFTFWLWDGTSDSGLPVTVWNRRCEDLYASLCRASVVHVSGYRLGKWAIGFEEGQYEWRANVNTSNPVGQVRPLTYGLVEQEWGEETASRRLPELPAPASVARGYLEATASRLAQATAEAAEDDAAHGADGAFDRAASRAGVSAAEYAHGAFSEPDASEQGMLEEGGGGGGGGPLHAPLDLACVVVRALAPFRVRIPANGRRPARFKRARWLLVLPSDGLAPIPVLVYAYHVPAPSELELLFPEAASGPDAPTPFPVGAPLVLRNLVVVDGGAPALRLSGSSGGGGSGSGSGGGGGGGGGGGSSSGSSR